MALTGISNASHCGMSRTSRPAAMFFFRWSDDVFSFERQNPQNFAIVGRESTGCGKGLGLATASSKAPLVDGRSVDHRTCRPLM
jgi:hypothetical protein